MLVAIEVGSYLYLRNIGVHSDLFFTLKNIDVTRDDGYNTIDPHLGYAHGIDDPKIRKLNKEFTWIDGFVVYAKEAKQIRELQRPVILALGGSTTDGVQYGHSWPEHLARMLRESGTPGTVVNGGTGGYSTNQELLKLVRDGLEFKPDLVISYSGINDRGSYSELPNPMTHKYQRSLLTFLTQNSSSPLLPSTIKVLQRIIGIDTKDNIGYTLGVPTDRTLGQQYEKNMQLMHAVSNSAGAEFVAFIQPYGNYGKSGIDSENKKIRKNYSEKVKALYDEITQLPSRVEYIRDATNILDEYPDLFKEDDVHLLDRGDEVVARHIFNEIKPMLGTMSAADR